MAEKGNGEICRQGGYGHHVCRQVKGLGLGRKKRGGQKEGVRRLRFLVAVLLILPFLPQLRCHSGWQPLGAAEEVCPEWQPPALLCRGLLLARVGAGGAVP